MALGYVDVEPEAVQLQPPHAHQQSAGREAGPHAHAQAQGTPHADAPAAPLGGGLGNGLYASQEDHVSRFLYTMYFPLLLGIVLRFLLRPCLLALVWTPNCW